MRIGRHLTFLGLGIGVWQRDSYGKFLRSRQCLRQRGRQGVGNQQLVFRDADRAAHVPQRIFDDNPVALPAKDQADARVSSGCRSCSSSAAR